MKYTYLFYSTETRLTKIGRTISPKRRFNTLGGNKKLKVIALLLGDMERSLHDFHKSDRVTGEWFNLSKEVLDKYSSDYGVQDLPSGFIKGDLKMIYVTDEAHRALKVKSAELGIKIPEVASEVILAGIAKVKNPKVKTTKNKEA